MARYRGTTTERGLGGDHQADKRRLLAQHREGTACWRCGQPMFKSQGLERDHVIDRARGGAQGPAVLAHMECNRAAGARLGNQMQPRVIMAAAHDVRCGTCGKPYHYAARACEVCGVHYHPSGKTVRTCSRAHGVELRRRNRGARPVGDRVRSAGIAVTVPPPLRTSREWLVPDGRTYGKPLACTICIRRCVWCSSLFVGRKANQRACSMDCGRRHNWAKSNAARRVMEHACTCGVTIQPHRHKCDDCVRETKRQRKRRERQCARERR